MAKYDFLPDSVNRKRRIIGRMITKKSLPAFVYRFDTRPPAEIRRRGFEPWKEDGTITIMEHVNNAHSTTDEEAGIVAGQEAKHASQFVSCGAYGLCKNIDPTFAQQLLTTNLYKIDASAALRSGPFFDANDVFDRAGVNRPYSTQREWIKLGGILPAAVTNFMTGRQFYDQMTGLVAPDEGLLDNWQDF